MPFALMYSYAELACFKQQYLSPGFSSDAMWVCEIYTTSSVGTIHFHLVGVMCYRCVTGVLQACYRCVTEVLQVCYRCVTGVTGVLQVLQVLYT